MGSASNELPGSVRHRLRSAFDIEAAVLALAFIAAGIIWRNILP